MTKMYKLVLVDDEDEVRGRIASQISSDSGFEIVGRAGNGHDALDIIEKTRPDVVLTDIKMPFIDGIELAKRIRRNYPMIRVAFITGYDEFNYAKQAVELQVVKYLMKPVTSSEINAFLQELYGSLEQEYREKQDLLIAKEKYENLLPLMGDSFLSSLLYTTTLSTDDLEKLELYNIKVTKHQDFQTCMVGIIDTPKQSLKTIEQLKVNTNEIFKSLFAGVAFKHSLLVADGLVFVFTTERLDKREIDALLSELIETSKEYMKVDITIGVSSVFSSFRDFPSSYHQSKRAQSYAGKYDFGPLVYLDELKDYKTEDVMISLQDYLTLDQLLHYGDKKSMTEKIEEIKRSILGSNAPINIEYLRLELSHLVMYLASKAEVSLAEISETDLITTYRMAQHIEDVFQQTHSYVLAIRDNDIRKQLSRSEKLTQEAMDYIEENYSNSELSLEELSSHLNVSFSHLSMLFKKHSGITFSNYLINVRMEKAKEILENTALKIIDIAFMCGYSDVYYFSHSFKKYTGVSPRKYREQ